MNPTAEEIKAAKEEARKARQEFGDMLRWLKLRALRVERFNRRMRKEGAV